MRMQLRIQGPAGAMLKPRHHQPLGVVDHHPVAAPPGQRRVILQIRQPGLLDRGDMRGADLRRAPRARRSRTAPTPTWAPRTSRRSRSPHRAPATAAPTARRSRDGTPPRTRAPTTPPSPPRRSPPRPRPDPSTRPAPHPRPRSSPRGRPRPPGRSTPSARAFITPMLNTGVTPAAVTPAARAVRELPHRRCNCLTFVSVGVVIGVLGDSGVVVSAPGPVVDRVLCDRVRRRRVWSLTQTKCARDPGCDSSRQRNQRLDQTTRTNTSACTASRSNAQRRDECASEASQAPRVVSSIAVSLECRDRDANGSTACTAALSALQARRRGEHHGEHRQATERQVARPLARVLGWTAEDEALRPEGRRGAVPRRRSAPPAHRHVHAAVGRSDHRRRVRRGLAGRRTWAPGHARAGRARTAPLHPARRSVHDRSPASVEPTSRSGRRRCRGAVDRPHWST